jgi:hypothetical protein
MKQWSWVDEVAGDERLGSEIDRRNPPASGLFVLARDCESLQLAIATILFDTVSGSKFDVLQIYDFEIRDCRDIGEGMP